MKKLFVLLVAALALGACEIEEISDGKLYSFPSVFGNKRLQFIVKQENAFAPVKFLNPDGTPDIERLVVAQIYQTDCPQCEKQAAAFEKLAEEFKYTPIEFIVLFVGTDSYDAQKLAEINWVKNAFGKPNAAVQVYANTPSTCPNAEFRGQCMDIFETVKINQPMEYFITRGALNASWDYLWGPNATYETMREGVINFCNDSPWCETKESIQEELTKSLSQQIR